MDLLNGFDPATWLQLGFLGVLLVFAIGVWRIAKPAADAWLAQYKSLLDYTLQMTQVMASINSNLEQLNRGHEELSERMNDHEKGSERRHNEITRGLSGGLGRNRDNK